MGLAAEQVEASSSHVLRKVNDGDTAKASWIQTEKNRPAERQEERVQTSHSDSAGLSSNGITSPRPTCRCKTAQTAVSNSG
jgi:hypothetical protein